MPLHYKLYGALVTAVTAICVITSYHLPWIAAALGIQQFWIAGLAAIIGSAASSWILALSLKNKWIRKWIHRRAWLEGWWLLLTYPADGSREHKGLLQIKYVDGMKLEALSYYFDDELDHLTSKSYYLTVDEATMSYINYARIIDEGTDFNIVAVGGLYREDKPYPTIYRGDRVDLRNKRLHRQAMCKIPEALIRKYQRAHGDAWKEKLFASGELKPFIGKAAIKMRTVN
jgi:hypothetical protein